MLRFLRELFHRPTIKLGSLGHAPRSRGHLRNERFASYLASNNRRSVNSDRSDALLATRKLFRVGLVLGAIAFAAWVVVESAQAIGVF